MVFCSTKIQRLHNNIFISNKFQYLKFLKSHKNDDLYNLPVSCSPSASPFITSFRYFAFPKMCPSYIVDLFLILRGNSLSIWISGMSYFLSKVGTSSILLKVHISKWSNLGIVTVPVSIMDIALNRTIEKVGTLHFYKTSL